MNLTDPIFTEANAAREYLEASRWADGASCPHCGGMDKCKKLEGSRHRPGLYQCGDCRQQFTVTVGKSRSGKFWIFMATKLTTPPKVNNTKSIMAGMGFWIDQEETFMVSAPLHCRHRPEKRHRNRPSDRHSRSR